MLSGSSSGGSGDDEILDSLEPTASYADLGEAIKAAFDGLLLREEKFDPRKAIIILEKFSTDLRKDDEKEEIISNSEILPVSDQRQLINVKQELLLDKQQTVEGCNGTLYWDGTNCEGIPVFVKRFPKTHEDVAIISRNFQLLKKSPCHPNIIRHHVIMTTNQDDVHLALEPYLCTLEDLVKICHPLSYEEVTIDVDGSYFTRTLTVQKNDRLMPLAKILIDHRVKLTMIENGRPSSLLLKLMRDIASGLVYLHDELGIAHGNLSPENILLVMAGSTLCAKLSDMGLSQKRSSSGDDNSDWQAPEQHGCLGRQTREADMYSFGRIISYKITGIPPFGNTKKVKTKRSSSPVGCPVACHLITCLTSKEAGKRPKAKDVLRHHVFWSSETRISFLCDTSDKVGNYKRTNLYQELERTRYAVIEGIWEGKTVKTWDKRIHHNIISYMNDYRKQKHNQGYDFSSVRELVRFIRNMAVHYEKLSLDVQEAVGPLHEGFDSYFTSRFPDLLTEVYKVVLKYHMKERFFCRYFIDDDVSVAN